jgi:hypothetical protein
MEYTYKIVEKKDNDLETIIEKGNLTTRFTIQDIKDHLEFTKKTLRESKGKLEAEKTQDKMAEAIMPSLKEIPEDKYNLVMMYAGRKLQRASLEDIVTTAEETIKSYTEQLAYIKETLGLTEEGEAVEKLTEVE